MNYIKHTYAEMKQQTKNQSLPLASGPEWKQTDQLGRNCRDPGKTG